MLSVHHHIPTPSSNLLLSYYRPRRLIAIMTNNSATVRLICILIGDDLKICDSPFTITVPSEEDFGGVIHYVKGVTPSLRDRDHGKFSFFKPPSDRPICISHSHHGLQLTREHLGRALLITWKVSEVFQEKGVDRRFDIDAIIHVSSGEHGTFFYLLIDKAMTFSRWHRWCRPAYFTCGIK